MNLEGIRVLLVEDNPGDVRLFLELLRETGAGHVKLEHVDRLGTALERLSNQAFDVVLLDLSLPDAHGLDTLVRAHAHAPSVPIVVLTGLDDQALAVKAVRAGAQDYLVKGRVDGDLLVRSMRYATERARALEALERRGEHYRSLIENSLDLISILNVDGTIRYASPSHERVLGYGLEEMVGQNAFSFIHADDLEKVRAAFARADGAASLQSRFRHKDGSWRMLESWTQSVAFARREWLGCQFARRHGPPAPGRATAPFSEIGSGWPAGRRSCARLQQSAHDHHRLFANIAGHDACGRSGARRCGASGEGRRASNRFDTPVAGLHQPPDGQTGDAESQCVGSGDGSNPQPVELRRHAS